MKHSRRFAALRQGWLFVKGAPEELLARAGWVDAGGRREPLTADRAASLGKAAAEMADCGLRVLAFAHRVLQPAHVLADAEQDLVLTALVGFEDPPRREVPAAVRRCREAGIKIIMLVLEEVRKAIVRRREGADAHPSDIGQISATAATRS